MSLEQTPHQEQNPHDANILDVEKMIESIQDPKEREVARTLLMPKKLTEEERAAKKQRQHAQSEAFKIANADREEKLRLQRKLAEEFPETEPTQDLTPQQQAFLDVNLHHERGKAPDRKDRPSQPPNPEHTQGLTPEEQMLLDKKLRESETSKPSTTNPTRKKVSFWKRLFN